MNDFLDDRRREISERLKELRPFVDEFNRLEEAASALATVRAIEAVVGDLGVPLLLHGFQTTVWTMLEEAGRCGYDTRIGLEDTLALPDGSPGSGNAELVRVARSRLRDVHS